MKRMSKRIFPFYYAPGKNLFHIIVKISDAPGSLSSVLSLISTRVNLIGISTYTLNDGTAILSAFAEALVQKQTTESLTRLIKGVEAAVDVEVQEGNGSVLVDAYHRGLDVGGESYLLMSRDSMTHVFGEIVRILGSGGEALLYAEGRAMGERYAKNLLELLGPEQVRAKSDYLRHVISAEGWGEVSPGEVDGKGLYHVKIEDCFECTIKEGNRKGCDFFRGYLEALSTEVIGQSFTSTETKCRLRGDPVCEFLMARKE